MGEVTRLVVANRGPHERSHSACANEHPCPYATVRCGLLSHPVTLVVGGDHRRWDATTILDRVPVGLPPPAQRRRVRRAGGGRGGPAAVGPSGNRSAARPGWAGPRGCPATRARASHDRRLGGLRTDGQPHPVQRADHVEHPLQRLVRIDRQLHVGPASRSPQSPCHPMIAETRRRLGRTASAPWASRSGPRKKPQTVEPSPQLPLTGTLPGTLPDLAEHPPHKQPRARRTVRPTSSVTTPSRRAPRSAHQTDDRLLLPVEEAARRLSIGGSLLYELLASGEIHSVHVGRLRRVPVTALIDFINRPLDQAGPNGPRSI